MGVRLTTAIDIADSATAILQRVEAFDWQDHQEKEGWDMKAHIGIDPMLLGLSMELALKAWYAFDHDKLITGHKLPKLFEALKPESQEKLDSEFKRSVAPLHPNFFYVNYGIDKVLYQHNDAFTDWRYMHDTRKKKTAISFEQSVFIATLEMVLSEFRKRYRTVEHPPRFSPFRS